MNMKHGEIQFQGCIKCNKCINDTKNEGFLEFGFMFFLPFNI